MSFGNRFKMLNEQNNDINTTDTNTNAQPKSWATITSKPAVPIIKNIVIANEDTGEDYVLPYTYTLWYHNLNDHNWKIDSFIKMCNISNVSEFWRFINNFNKIGYKNRDIFLMREGIDPMWEHPENRNGGICSFRVEMHNALEMYEHLCMHMVLNLICDIPNDITGISFMPKGHTAFVKIWNKDKDNDLSHSLNKSILDKYSNTKVSIKYRPNNPEF